MSIAKRCKSADVIGYVQTTPFPAVVESSLLLMLLVTGASQRTAQAMDHRAATTGIKVPSDHASCVARCHRMSQAMQATRFPEVLETVFYATGSIAVHSAGYGSQGGDYGRQGPERSCLMRCKMSQDVTGNAGHAVPSSA